MAEVGYTFYAWLDDDKNLAADDYATTIEQAAEQYDRLFGKPPFRLVAYDGRFLHVSETRKFEKLTGVALRPHPFKS